MKTGGLRYSGFHRRREGVHLQADWSGDALWEHEVQTEAAGGAGGARWHGG